MYIYETKEDLIIDFLHNTHINIQSIPEEDALYHLMMYTDDIIMLNMTEKLYPNYESDSVRYNDLLKMVNWLDK